MARKAGAQKRIKKDGYDRCFKKCEAQLGVGTDAPPINGCFKKRPCEEYADCINEHLD
jgi:hypothetical protein